MKSLAPVLAIAALLCAGSVSRADTLNGTTVDGTLSIPSVITDFNFFNSTFNPSVPATATVGSGIEFSAGGVFGSNCSFTTDLSNTQIAVGQDCSQGTPVGFQIVLTDPAFLGMTLSSMTDPLGFNVSISGQTLTLTSAGAPGNLTTSFDVVTAPTPEPASWSLLALGMMGAFGLVRRNQNASTPA